MYALSRTRSQYKNNILECNTECWARIYNADNPRHLMTIVVNTNQENILKMILHSTYKSQLYHNTHINTY